MDTDVWPDNLKEAAVMIGLVVSIIGIIGLWNTNPGLIFRAEALFEQLTVGSVPGIGYSASAENVTLRIENREVEQLNVNSRETTYEYAYCGVMSGPYTISNAWLTDTVEASQTETTFSVDNCPFSAVTSYKSLIHYQPTSLRLSENRPTNGTSVRLRLHVCHEGSGIDRTWHTDDEFPMLLRSKVCKW
ncbi:hypothetical protein [Haloquadratum walsbyi]|uniref:Uncharacterized protein n=1 Tax=Haloquadratum walsbyi J07HQW2 TaxID=1238425 RepID=U1MUE8_9EURY|nr:hypothetical protein [Haloquadratum walsbyi]ERG93944.1 MAG: hypothetical protein J07HQW2_00378 [Haloquadratum walsbyi J07HQW2]